MSISQKRGQCIPIVMAFDPGYLMQSAVAILSVLKNGRTKTRYHFYILTDSKYDGMDDGLFALLKRQYPCFSYEYRLIDERDLSGFHLPIHVPSVMSFVRLTVAEQLSELEYCVYLDGDILVRSDLAELVALAQADDAFQDSYLMAAPDLTLQNGDGVFFSRFRETLGTEDLTNYFNAGVMVMNLRKLREDHMGERFTDHMGRPYVFADQDILNVCCRGRTRMLPVFWNMCAANIGDESAILTGCTERDRIDVMTGNAGILHFAGTDKPWNQIETQWEHEWHCAARLLPETPLTGEFMQGLERIDHYDPNDDRTNVVRDAKRYVLYGFTGISRRLMDRLMRRGVRAPEWFCDNDPEKYEGEYRGVRCLPWSEVRNRIDGETVIVLCGQSSWREMHRALVQDGVFDGRIVRYRKRDFALVACDKPYNIGLLMGVFDLFHIGHLNLIRRAKAQCRYLRIGVLSDDLVYAFKQIRPTIPQEERMEVLRALRDVDEVVLLETKEDVSRLNEWKKRPFDCFFSGDDYRGNAYWAWEKQELQKMGSDIVFFPYTKEQSSTMIRQALKRDHDKENSKGDH